MPMHEPCTEPTVSSFSGKRIEARNGGQILVGYVVNTNFHQNHLTLLVDDAGTGGAGIILSPEDGWTFKAIFYLPKNTFAVVRVGRGFYTRVGTNEWQDEYGVLLNNAAILRGFEQGNADVLYEGVSK